MAMCIHRAIRELEEGANLKLPEDIKSCLISESEHLTITSVQKGNPFCYMGLFYKGLLNRSSKLIQNGKLYSSFPLPLDESLPAVLIDSGTLMVYLPQQK